MKLTGSFHSSKIEDGTLAADLDYEAKDSTSVLKFQHTMQGIILGANYMQRVQKHLMLGFDYTYLVIVLLIVS